MGRWKVLLLVLCATVVTATCAMAAEKSFHATMTGKQETPPVRTDATGKADLKLSRDGKELIYKLTVKNIQEPTAAHIHSGPTGVNGPVVANLFTGPKKDGKFSGVLAQGTLTAQNLTGDLQGKTLADLVKLIQSGGAYVNVHSEMNADGVIRGQLK